MNESAILAKYVANTVYDDLPERAVEMTKMSLLDALGVTLAASGLCDECRAFVEIAMESGGKKESTILGFQAKVPAHMAAFANGSMGHALDFEDAHDKALVHPNAVSVPVALALAELMGNVDGKKLITALAVGCDLVCRLGLAFKENPIIVRPLNQMLCEPVEVKTTPRQVIDAKFSIPFSIATALYYKSVGLEHFTPKKLKNETVLQLARKTRYHMESGVGLREATMGFLEIRTKANKTYSKQVDYAYGHPQKPISKEDLVNKFVDCADKAAKKIPLINLEEAIKYIMTLEQVQDIRDIMVLFRRKNNL